MSTPTTFNVTKVTILVKNGSTDKVYMATDLPGPYSPEVSKEPLTIHFDCAHKTGMHYVLENFPLVKTIELIDMNSYATVILGRTGPRTAKAIGKYE